MKYIKIVSRKVKDSRWCWGLDLVEDDKDFCREGSFFSQNVIWFLNRCCFIEKDLLMFRQFFVLMLNGGQQIFRVLVLGFLQQRFIKV